MLDDLLPDFLRTYAMRFRIAGRTTRRFGLATAPPGACAAVDVDDALSVLATQLDWLAACMAHFGERGGLGVQAFADSAPEVCEALAHCIAREQPRLPVTLTIGDVDVAGRPLTGFDAGRFAAHARGDGSRARAHAWLTVGDALVIDPTLASRLNRDGGGDWAAFGGAFAGAPGALDLVDVPGIACCRPRLHGALEYRPVAIGDEAFAVAYRGARRPPAAKPREVAARDAA